MKKDKPLLNALFGKQNTRTPIWFMRQAGRYLPEYKALRSQTESFMHAVLTPEIAAEITLQPIRRFDIDAAIIFSDILVIPYAMGIPVEFHEGIGPILQYNLFEPLKENIELFDSTIKSVCETISIVKRNLNANFPNVATIGFAGAPWTVACYMIEKNRKGGEFTHTRRIAYEHRRLFQNLIDVITNATIEFLLAQIAAGAEVIKIFDSHAGLLGQSEFEQFVIKPMQKIMQAIAHTNIPVIGFPRKAGVLYENFIHETKVNCVAVDHTLPLTWIRDNIQSKTCVQGNLDNIYLTLENATDALSDSVKRILKALRNSSQQRFIFNLGHGCLPETKVENIEFVINQVRKKEF